MGAEAEKNQQQSQIRFPVPTAAPNPNPNSLTQAQFLAWKRRKTASSALTVNLPSAQSILSKLLDASKDADASARKAEVTRKREEDTAAGTVQMNGRELFTHEPWVFDNSCY